MIEVTLCFLEVAGARGVLYDLGGNEKLLYAWNISIFTNNKAEVYTPLGIKIGKGTEYPQLYGDMRL